MDTHGQAHIVTDLQRQRQRTYDKPVPKPTVDSRGLATLNMRPGFTPRCVCVMPSPQER
jgi:hypothetical protein